MALSLQFPREVTKCLCGKGRVGVSRVQATGSTDPNDSRSDIIFLTCVLLAACLGGRGKTVPCRPDLRVFVHDTFMIQAKLKG